MNTAYNKQIHALLAQTGLTAAKATLVQSFTAGKYTSSTDLSNHQAIELIQYLKNALHKKQAAALAKQPVPIASAMPTITQNTPAQQANTMRKKIIALAHQMGWSAIHTTSGNKIADIKRINDWAIKYGYLHKALNDYTLVELPKLVTQFQNLYKTFLKAV